MWLLPPQPASPVSTTPMPRPLKTARHRGISETSLSLRVRKVATDAPFRRLVPEAYFWRLVFDGWRTNSSASWAPILLPAKPEGPMSKSQAQFFRQQIELNL
jgi:hypothetical protein